MSHHYSGPDFGFPRGDARLDLTDLYAFPKPGGVSRSILILNVHPSFGIDPPEPTTPEPFSPDALYELKIDTNGDAVADIAYRVRFSPFKDGVQTATLRCVTGVQAAGVGDDGQVIVEGAPVSLGREARVTEAGDYRFFAGWRSDPFFFDPLGAVNNFEFVKLMPHRHPEDRLYTVMSGVFYIGLGEKFDGDGVKAYPPGSVIILPGDTWHIHWAKSGEYVTQVTAIGPLGLEYQNSGDDPRQHRRHPASSASAAAGADHRGKS